MRSTNREESARWLLRIAVRRQQGAPVRIRPPYAQRPKSPPADVPAAMLSAVPGISHVIATRLLNRFGDVASIASASPEDWMH